MSYVESLASHGEALGITPGSTSYFSAPSEELDPTLFTDTSLDTWVKEGILGILFDYLATSFKSPHLWVSAWLAGSAVSYQWEASRSPGDLDCLVGINYPVFRRENPGYSGMSSSEIAGMLNEDFSSDIMSKTSNWHGYELTYYVNQQSNIVDINPYAAYDLIHDTWTVPPSKSVAPPYSRIWDAKAASDATLGQTIMKRYATSLNDVRNASNPAYRLNAERNLKESVSQGVALYDDIHHGRRLAFSKTGSGYSDYNNYRWQAGKRSGVIPALRSLKNLHNTAVQEDQQEVYGMTLPSHTDLIRRAATRGL
jgi:hypothetical protein